MNGALQLFGNEEESIPTTEPEQGTAWYYNFKPISDELYRARTKFPSSVLCLPALLEEVGELADAMFAEADAEAPEWHYAMEAEANQVAVMAIRCRDEGDPAMQNNDDYLTTEEYNEYLGLVQQASILGAECKHFIEGVLARRKEAGL